MAEVEEGRVPEEEASVEAPTENAGEVASEQPAVEEGIPQWRFNEVNAARKAAEERAQMYQQALAQAGVSPEKPQTPKKESNLNEDQKWLQDTFTPVLDQYMGPIKREMQTVMDRQQHDTFWEPMKGRIPGDVVNSVEEDLQQARNNGIDNVSREHLLDYHLGRYHRNELLTKTNTATQTQQRVQETNKVAVVESGSTTTEPPEKKMEDMSADEILAKFGNEPFG